MNRQLGTSSTTFFVTVALSDGTSVEIPRLQRRRSFVSRSEGWRLTRIWKQSLVCVSVPIMSLRIVTFFLIRVRARPRLCTLKRRPGRLASDEPFGGAIVLKKTDSNVTHHQIQLRESDQWRRRQERIRHWG